MKAVAVRLCALEGLARRTICPAPASSSAAIAYAAALTLLAEVFGLLAKLEAGKGDAAILRLGHYDLIQLRSRRLTIEDALEVIAGFGATSERSDRRHALARLESQLSDIRDALSISAVAA